MAKSLLAAVLVLAILAAASACSVPPSSCTKSRCAALKTTPKQNSKPVGYWYGIWNNVSWPNKANANMKRGGPFVNYEIFMELGKYVGKTKATTLAQCCSDCAATDKCYQFHFFPALKYAAKTKVQMGANFDANYKCYLIGGGGAKDDDKVRGTPFSGTYTQQKKYMSSIDASWVGGSCNGNPGVKDDPHFAGALGTRFDFNGEVGAPFCLVSDERLHINAVMGGYQAAESAESAEGSKHLRTWIQEVGITWRDAQGEKHTARLTARKGTEQARGSQGFLASLEIDGQVVAVPQEVGQVVSGAGDFALTYAGAGKKGMFDIDEFNMKIADLADVSMKMRVAHPLLQTSEEAFAHFNLHFNDLKATPNVHGVLGQTFRQTGTQAEKALQYSLLAKLLRGPIVAADGANGEGFLDGKTADYRSSSALATDCAFSSFVA